MFKQRFADSIERIRRIERSRAESIRVIKSIKSINSPSECKPELERVFKSISERERAYSKAIMSEIIPIKINIEWLHKPDSKPNSYDDYIDHA